MKPLYIVQYSSTKSQRIIDTCITYNENEAIKDFNSRCGISKKTDEPYYVRLTKIYEVEGVLVSEILKVY